MKRFILLLLFAPLVMFSQSKLQKAKKNLNTKSAKVATKSTRKVRTSTRNSSSKFENPFSNLLLEVGFYATLGIVVGQAQECDLNPYPYFYNDEGEYAKILSNTGRKQNLKLGANYIFNNVNGFELNAIFKPIPILGIDVSHLHFSEKNRTKTEVLDITSLQINYHRFREKNITLWWGAGISYVANEIKTTGFAYNVGTEIYPFNPISVHVSWKQSFINESEITVFKSQLKYHFKNKNFFIGYHNYHIGSETITAPTLGFEITF